MGILETLLIGAAKHGIKKGIDSLFSRNIIGQLNAAIKQWANELPPERYVNPAVFLRDDDYVQSDTSINYNNLKIALQNNDIPSEDMWFSFLFERWEYVRTKISEPQAFFTIEQEQAKIDLRQLSKILHDMCARDNSMANQHLVRVVDELQDQYAENSNKEVDEELIIKNLYTYSNNQVMKQINCKKYIPNVYVEINEIKDNARHFVIPFLFWNKIIEEIERININFLNSLIAEYAQEPFSLDIPEELRNLVSQEDIDSKSQSLIKWSESKIDYLNYLDELTRNYYKTSHEQNRYSLEWKRFIIDMPISEICHKLEHIIHLIKLIIAQVVFIISPAGQGKTNFVCDFVQNVLFKRNVPCLYLNAKDLNPVCMGKMISRAILPLNEDTNIQDILGAISNICHQKGTVFTIIIDGLNEHAEITDFSTSLEELIEILLRYNFIKIILTCRTEYFNYRFNNLIKSGFSQKIVKYENIHNTIIDVGKERLLQGYFTFFHLSFSFLTKYAANILAEDPLLLRIFCEAYGNPVSDKDIRLPAIYDIHKEELFRKYYEEKCDNIVSRDNQGLGVGTKKPFNELIKRIILYMINNNIYENIPIDTFLDQVPLLEKIIDEDIIFRKDLLTADILDTSGEVLNFTFDEFRDYLIANVLVRQVSKNDPNRFEALLVHNLIVKSPIYEGVTKYLFHITKRENDRKVSDIICKQPWFNTIYYQEIFSVKDEFINDADIQKIKEWFKQGIEVSSNIIHQLIFRWDIDTFKNLNIELLVNIIRDLTQAEYENLVEPYFVDKTKRSWYYRSGIQHLVWDIDDFAKWIENAIEGNNLLHEQSLLKLFELLLYLFPIRGDNHYFKAMDTYERFAEKYPDLAENQLKETVSHQIINDKITGKIRDIIELLCRKGILKSDKFMKKV